MKSRKQSFGVNVYDLMEDLEASGNDLSVAEKEKKIRSEFDCARKDIAVVQAKIDCKRDEIKALEKSSSVGNTSNTSTAVTTPVGNQPTSNFVIQSGHPSDS